MEGSLPVQHSRHPMAVLDLRLAWRRHVSAIRSGLDAALCARSFGSCASKSGKSRRDSVKVARYVVPGKVLKR